MGIEITKNFTKWLKTQGCVVVEREEDSLIFFKDGFYGMAEIKAHRNSPHRPGQDKWCKKFDEWSWCKFVYAENLNDIKTELKEILRD